MLTHPLGRERVLVAHAAAEGHDDDAAFGLSGRARALREGAARQEQVGHARREHAQRVAPTHRSQLVLSRSHFFLQYSMISPPVIFRVSSGKSNG